MPCAARTFLLRLRRGSSDRLPGCFQPTKVGKNTTKKDKPLKNDLSFKIFCVKAFRFALENMKSVTLRSTLPNAERSRFCEQGRDLQSLSNMGCQYSDSCRYIGGSSANRA